MTIGPSKSTVPGPLLPALTAVALALLATGCGGGGDGIPQNDARALEEQLADAERQFEEGDCVGLTTDTIPSLRTAVDNLPGRVEPPIRDTLSDAVDQLVTLASECEEPETETEPTPTVTTPPPETETTPPETQATEATDTGTIPSRPPRGRGEPLDDDVGPPEEGGPPPGRGAPPGRGGTPPGQVDGEDGEGGD